MYFEKTGDHISKVSACVAQYVKDRGIKHVVIATTGGASAEALSGLLPGVTITAVTHVIGSRENGVDTMGSERREELKAKGLQLVTATHLLSGVERAISGKFGGAYPVEIMAHTLRMFGAGVKVGVECAVMALDAGAIPYGEEVVAIGGTGRGVDTAIGIIPGHGPRIFDTVITEVICKPRDISR